MDRENQLKKAFSSIERARMENEDQELLKSVASVEYAIEYLKAYKYLTLSEMKEEDLK